MNRSIFCLASLMVMPLMGYDPPPSCLANPLSGLSGNYAFQVEGIFPNLYGITGTLNATIGTDRAGAAIGLLKIVATSFYDPSGPIRLMPAGADQKAAADPDLRDASVTRLEANIGTFQVNSACTGGTLTFNLGSRPMQFDFWFLDGGRRLYLVSSINGLAATGVAVAGPTGCPAGLTDPLQLLPVRWAFVARGAGGPVERILQPFPDSVRNGVVIDNRVNDPYAIAGFWNASVGTNRANTLVGLLAITATSNLGLGGSITRSETNTGGFQVNADCSGGTLTFTLGSRPMQFDFWYVDGFQKMYFIATNGLPVLGEASR